MRETPRRVLQEQEAVKNLEFEANKLKSELASLQQQKQSRFQAQAQSVLHEIKNQETALKVAVGSGQEEPLTSPQTSVNNASSGLSESDLFVEEKWTRGCPRPLTFETDDSDIEDY
jgi:seryl-tRNA synthetase